MQLFPAFRCFFMAMPLQVLERTLNKKITLLLKDGRKLEGKLAGYDDYMNMVLHDTSEMTEDTERRLGIVVLRGNNIVCISPS